MEVLLLAWDEIDDLIGCIRKVWLGVRTTFRPRPRTTARTSRVPARASLTTDVPDSLGPSGRA